ncbi:hypothetical protein [Novosphingobium sp.]|uniref:hypothetical protein n=1 Tax=Novosphingobium sp. TaxID=1874826 RepID=UPI001D247DD9|nr:hypothetical protein [Novosphingobium sp.]MBX9661926.1 hypothetical protein [Novosphingobium sp.]
MSLLTLFQLNLVAVSVPVTVLPQHAYTATGRERASTATPRQRADKAKRRNRSFAATSRRRAFTAGH